MIGGVVNNTPLFFEKIILRRAAIYGKISNGKLTEGEVLICIR